MRESQTTAFERTLTDNLSVDDRLLIRAIAIVGDVMREREVARLLERWPWGRPMTWERVRALEERGLLLRATDGWYVAHEVDAQVASGIGAAVQRLLTPFVGAIVCAEAETIDRFRIGLRRVLVAEDHRHVVALCRVWGESPAGRAGPRGLAFVEAVGLQRAAAPLRVRLVTAVPEAVRSSSLRTWVRDLWRALRVRGDQQHVLTVD